MDKNQKDEVVIFEDPQAKNEKHTGKQDSTQRAQQQNNQQTDNTQQTQSPQDPQKQGEQEGIKEVAKQEEQAKDQTPDMLQQQGKNEGVKEMAKESIKTQQGAEKKLESLVEQTQNPMLKIKTTGFLNLLPDYVTVDPVKVTIIIHSWLSGKSEKSIFVKDIADVTVESTTFASSLHIVSNTDKEHPTVIKPFKKDDAEKAKNMIKGLLTAEKENIDITTLKSTPDVAEKVEKLGEVG